MSKTKSLALILGVLIMSFLVGYLVLAWDEPKVSPPGDNVPAPLNVSDVRQQKIGALNIGLNNPTIPTGYLSAERYCSNYDMTPCEWYIDPANSGYAALFQGNVGIGTTGPSAKLDVVGAANITNAIYLGTQGSWGSSSIHSRDFTFRINDLQRERPLFYRDWSASEGDFLKINNVHGGGAAFDDQIWLTDVKGIVFYTNGTERMRINPSGNVGIGTTNPTQELHVVGNVRVTGLNTCSDPITGKLYATASGDIVCGTDQGGGGAGYWTQAGSNLYPNNTAWNVGIGTNSPNPNYILDVNGRIATPYLKSPFDGDINKDGDINSYDLRLVVEAFRCKLGEACWDEVIGADNLGNYLYKRDCDLDGSGEVDIADVVLVTDNYKTLITPYTRAPKAGDVNKDGYVNTEDMILVVKAYRCKLGEACWDELIGADNLGNRLFGRDADADGSDEIDIGDVVMVTSNYEPYNFLVSHQFRGLPAAEFHGDTIVTDDGYLQIEKTSDGVPPGEDCNSEAERGRFAIDTTSSPNRLYICMGAAGWKYATLNP